MGFENIIAWQKSKELTILVYKVFTKNKDFGFKDQIQRASVSIMNNIAEGYERRHDTKDFKYFLYVSKGSCGEVRSMITLALELKYISKEEFEKLHNLATETSKILFGLINSL